MSSTKYFHEFDVQDLQFIEEPTATTDADTFYEPAAPTASSFIAQQATLSMGVDPGVVPIYGYGRRPYTLVTTVETAGIAFDFPLRKTKGITFLKYGVNAPNAAGTCDRALSVTCKMVDDAGTTRYFKVKHARIASAAIIYAPGILMASVRLSCHFHAFDAVAPTNWTWQSDPGETNFPFIRASDGGANNWTLTEQNGPTAYTPKIGGAQLRFDNEMSLIMDGSHTSGWSDNRVGRQSMSGLINCAAKATGNEWYNIWTAIKSAYYFDVDWVILSGTHSLDADDFKFSCPEIPRPARMGPRILPLTIVEGLGPVVMV